MKAPGSATGFWAMSSAAACCLHLIDATCEHAGKAYKTVRGELDAYAETLSDKVEIVALNKIDAVEPDELKKQRDRLKRAAKKTPLLMSGVTGQGVPEALRALVAVIGEAPVSDKAKAAADVEPWSPITARDRSEWSWGARSWSPLRAARGEATSERSEAGRVRAWHGSSSALNSPVGRPSPQPSPRKSGAREPAVLALKSDYSP